MRLMDIMAASLHTFAISAPEYPDVFSERVAVQTKRHSREEQEEKGRPGGSGVTRGEGKEGKAKKKRRVEEGIQCTEKTPAYQDQHPPPTRRPPWRYEIELPDPLLPGVVCKYVFLTFA